MSYRAVRPGLLPGPSITVAGVDLPPGRVIVPDPDFASDDPTGEVVLWVSEQAVARIGAIWGRLAAAFPQTGLWPLVLSSLGSEDERPWLVGELDPSACTPPELHDVAGTLDGWWSSDDGRGFPGLAPASAAPVRAGAAEELAVTLEGRLGLVPVTRPADAPFALGWTGPLNLDGDTGKFSAVLRSWEERFGAYLIGIGFDTLQLAVQRPPSSLPAAQAIAAEHFAFCPDNVHQGAGSLEAYAGQLVDAPVWTFWWD